MNNNNDDDRLNRNLGLMLARRATEQILNQLELSAEGGIREQISKVNIRQLIKDLNRIADEMEDLNGSEVVRGIAKLASKLVQDNLHHKNSFQGDSN